MKDYKSEFMQRVEARGFMHQCTDKAALDAMLAEYEARGEPFVTYIGFDCTAPSLHVGSLMQIMLLRHAQQCGHKPIVLLGGGTTKIGDPSGKDKSREMLGENVIEHNKAELAKVFKLFLEFGDDAHDALMVDNADWLDNLNYIEFLQNYGRHFSVNKMLTMESVKQRLDRESHLSFLEFNYMLLQAYDFVELNRRHNVRLQIGGSDQWGNITMGSDLIKRQPSFSSENEQRMEMKAASISEQYIKAEIDDDFREHPFCLLEKKENSLEFAKSYSDVFYSQFDKDDNEKYSKLMKGRLENLNVFGLTTPLLTTAAGAKMGKTADGAVWLNPDMLSAYDYWQFWRNCDDADVGRFLRYFTELPLEDIERLEVAEGSGINEAKKTLATEATALLHGREAAQAAADTARQAFEQGTLGGDIPTITLSLAEHGAELPAFKLFLETGLASSGAEARRLIKGGGAKLDGKKVSDAMQMVMLGDHREQPLPCSVGKKKHVLVEVVD